MGLVFSHYKSSAFFVHTDLWVYNASCNNHLLIGHALYNWAGVEGL